jgi:hypothetical protein
VQAAIGFICSTLSGPWLNHQEIEQRLNPRLLPLAAQVAPPFSVAFLKRQ